MIFLSSFALNKAIDLVGFNPQETNVIIIIGEKADFSTERRRAADVSNIRLVSVKWYNARISNWLTLTYVVYSWIKKLILQNKFRIDLKNILLETSKAQYNDYKGLSQSLEGKSTLEHRNLISIRCANDDDQAIFKLYVFILSLWIQ